jgi:hypothetical protein
LIATKPGQLHSEELRYACYRGHDNAVLLRQFGDFGLACLNMHDGLKKRTVFLPDPEAASGNTTLASVVVVSLLAMV